MGRLFNILVLSMSVLFAAVSCSPDGNGHASALESPGSLYLPRNQYPLDITVGQAVVFEWDYSATDNVCYQVLFDREDGDFSSPAYIVTSDANGFSPSVEVSSATMSTIASLCGGLPGQTVAVKWTVRTFRGLESVTGTKDGEARTVLVTRPNTVDPLPASIQMQGTATENGSSVKFCQALPVGTALGQHIADRQKGAMECFTRFTDGEFTVKDDLDRFYALEDGGRLLCTYTQETSNHAPSEGIYWVYLDFNTMSWSMKEISSLVLWTHPWFGAEDTAPLSYEGNGVWAIVDYAWKVGNESQRDTRYHFNVTYADGSVERWSFWDDDCRNNATPETDP
ncbi:MAG: SusE domain-containing protein, partial [Clostridium sp.]|nr:SusE domain-containing protein [Clostridium sp.]